MEEQKQEQEQSLNPEQMLEGLAQMFGPGQAMNPEQAQNPEQTLVELKNANAVVELPVNAVKIKLCVTYYADDQLNECYRIMELSEIQQAFQLARDYYEDPDARYTLTDKGREYLDELEKKQKRIR